MIASTTSQVFSSRPTQDFGGANAIDLHSDLVAEINIKSLCCLSVCQPSAKISLKNLVKSRPKVLADEEAKTQEILQKNLT